MDIKTIKISPLHIEEVWERFFLPVQGYMNGKIWYIFNTIWIEEVQG